MELSHQINTYRLPRTKLPSSIFAEPTEVQIHREWDSGDPERVSSAWVQIERSDASVELTLDDLRPLIEVLQAILDLGD